MTDYVKSFAYESYIRLARNCMTDEFGAHNTYMLNLIYKDNGDNCVNHLKHSKVLADIKKKMTSATKFAIKRKLSKLDKQQLTLNLDKIESAQTAAELLDICNEGIEVLLKYKPFS